MGSDYTKAREAVARTIYESTAMDFWEDADSVTRPACLVIADAAIDAFLSSLKAQGLVVVPEVATEEMLTAGGSVPALEEVNSIIAFNAARTGTSGLSSDPLPAIYAAMISASQSVK